MQCPYYDCLSDDCEVWAARLSESISYGNGSNDSRDSSGVSRAQQWAKEFDGAACRHCPKNATAANILSPFQICMQNYQRDVVHELIMAEVAKLIADGAGEELDGMYGDCGNNDDDSDDFVISEGLVG